MSDMAVTQMTVMIINPLQLADGGSRSGTVLPLFSVCCWSVAGPEPFGVCHQPIGRIRSQGLTELLAH